MAQHPIRTPAQVRPSKRDLHGILIVDKPEGPTSHDVVAQLRRALGTRAIGHAGTLDPAATGVLVIAVGEATKLTAYLTGQDKAYIATVSFGRATSTLDAQGEVTEEGPLPPAFRAELESVTRGNSASGLLGRALDAELARTEQIPPAFSAIKQQGRPVHERARNGEIVDLPPRPIEVRSLEVLGAEANRLTIGLCVSKGYYVRSFARDLGIHLDCPAHLASLRRTASGPFSLAEAVASSSPPEFLLSSLLPLPLAACRALPYAGLTEAGTQRARQGKRLRPDDFSASPPGQLAAWLSPAGALVAIGEPNEEGAFVVRRGFVELPA